MKVLKLMILAVLFTGSSALAYGPMNYRSVACVELAEDVRNECLDAQVPAWYPGEGLSGLEYDIDINACERAYNAAFIGCYFGSQSSE